MPVLEGTSDIRSTLGWRGTLITQYDIMRYPAEISKSTPSIMRELLAKRLQQVSWQVAAELVRRGLYLYAVLDCRLLEMDRYYSVDLLLNLLVQPYKERLTIDEINYWEAKFAERLMFDLMAYVSRQIPRYLLADYPSAAPAPKAYDVSKPGVVTPEEYKARLERADDEVVKILKMANLMVEKAPSFGEPIPPPSMYAFDPNTGKYFVTKEYLALKEELKLYKSATVGQGTQPKVVEHKWQIINLGKVDG